MKKLENIKNQESLRLTGKGFISEELGIMVLKICTRFSLQPRFYRYTYRDEFVAEAVARCLTHSLSGIDLSHPKCNPFSYLTQTAYNVFRQKIKKEKRLQKTIQNLSDKIYDNLEQEYEVKSRINKKDSIYFNSENENDKCTDDYQDE